MIGSTLRILLTVPSLAREFGGPLDVAQGLRRALGARGAHVRLVGAGTGQVDGLPIASFLRGTPIPRSFGALRAATARADVVHIFGYRDPVGLVGAMAAARASVPYLIEPCGMVRPKVRSLLAKRAYDAAIGRRVLDRAAIIVATSKLERRELLEEGVDRYRIRIRPNGITLPPSDAHRDDCIRKRFGVPMEAPLVLTIGRIARVKGLFDLVESVSRLPGAHLLIAGPDARDGTFPALVRRTSGLGGRVHIDPEGLWGRDKLQAFGDADCFALPSQTENFGNAAAEAAAAGLPVVVSDECGVAEVLDLAAHRVIGVGDVDALTAAIAELIRGGGPRRAAASAALKLRELLDWSSLVEVQLEIYREVLSGTGMGRPTT